MKIIRVLFFIILNILISAGTIWLVFTSLNLGISNQNELIDPAADFVNEEVIATVVPDKLLIDGVISAGNLEYERVVINHVGSDEISLSGWKLVDSKGEEYVFPPINLYPGSSITIYSKSGKDTVTELFWVMEKAVWESGEVVFLTDPAGYPQAMYVVP